MMGEKITITTKHGTWTTTEADIKAATWERESNIESRTICRMADVYNGSDWAENQSLTIHREGDECDWSGIATRNLKATDEDGRETMLCVRADKIWDEDGNTSYIAYPASKELGGAEEDVGWWNDEADVEYGDWGEPVNADDWMDIAMMPSECKPEVDYSEVAADWMSENCNAQTRYWMDDCRGFANEWTLYIDLGGRESLTLGDLNGTCCPDLADLREIDAESAAGYIADAVMSRDDYRREHCAESCVSAVVLG